MKEIGGPKVEIRLPGSGSFPNDASPFRQSNSSLPDRIQTRNVVRRLGYKEIALEGQRVVSYMRTVEGEYVIMVNKTSLTSLSCRSR